MKIIIQDTYHLYKEMLKLKEKERISFFEDKLMEPFRPMFQIMHMPMKPEMLGCLPLAGHDEEAALMLEQLKAAEVWREAQETLEKCAARFQKAGIEVPEQVVLGIYLGNPEHLASMQGYTGMGSIPGFIQMMIAPNAYNLPRLKAAIAHEFHHNVLFQNAKWNFMNVTVGKYLAVEGLAESFAASMFGEEFIGPWVTNVQGAELEKARAIVSNVIELQGFNEARRYMFGDQLVHMEGAESTGMPVCGGYAVGYHAVQMFLKKTGVTIESATVMDGEEIMKQSGYFKAK